MLTTYITVHQWQEKNIALSLLKLCSFGAWDTVVIVHGAHTIDSTILEISSVFVTIVVVDFSEIVQSSIDKGTSFHLSMFKTT